MHERLLELVGTNVGGGRFRLDRALGRGGMGAVFAGIEVATGRAVAIKLIHPGLGEDDEVMRRFAREAEVMARISHPHVVEVITAGGGGGEPPFIAMELLEGASLSERLKRGETFDAQRAIRIARQVLAAVAAGHAIGVVHRDLKPANVMLVEGRGGAGEIAKVVDYGVARLAMSDAMTRLTSTGQVVGTPSYMSPQQAMGEPAGPTADVYSVGAILHRIFAGEPPYGRGDYVDILKRMVADERARIHERSPRLGRLGEIIERAIAHDPEARYQSAEEMNDALASLDATAKSTIVDWRPPADLASLRVSYAPEESTPQAPPTRAELPGRAADVSNEAEERRWPRVLVTASVLLLVALAGAVGTWLWVGDADREEDTAPLAVAPTAVVPATEAVALPVVVPVADAAAHVGPDANAEGGAGAERRTKRGRMRSGGRRLVEVVFAGGEFRSRRARDVLSRLRGVADLTSCWPRGVPEPRSDRGVDFLIDLDEHGSPHAIHAVGNHYPEFNQCAIVQLRQVSYGPGAVERMRLAVSFYPAR